jgi:hypothetical protein
MAENSFLLLFKKNDFERWRFKAQKYNLLFDIFEERTDLNFKIMQKTSFGFKFKSISIFIFDFFFIQIARLNDEKS